MKSPDYMYGEELSQLDAGEVVMGILACILLYLSGGSYCPAY